MYTVTFYSFKGGVGRTMALVNVAYSLAAAGKRVLLVDFDLEAPGLTSYQGFECAQDRSGLVEYIREYQEHDAAPDAASYIVPCEIDGIPVWVMPAGQHRTAKYATDFNSINWRQLYSEQDGFLLFEDLKQQWAEYEAKGFDYVFIDSRTGHTDIGGICTRQLPDAVVVLFVPSKQNIDGLVPIIKTIRKEIAPVRDRPVRLHFCPSNVPAAAEQEEILSRRLEDAKQRLDYKKAAATIYHFDSLELLDQPIFAKTNAGSRLTKQLETLKEAITKENISDKPGALLALAELPARLRQASATNNRIELEDISAIAARIRAEYPHDGEVAWALAQLYHDMKRTEDELAVLEVVIFKGTNVPPALLQRAYLSSVTNKDRAVADLVRLVTSEQPTAFELVPALDLLRLLKPDLLPEALRAGMLNPRIDGAGKSLILLRMLTPGGDLIAARDVASAAIDSAGNGRDPLATSYVLTLIALGQYEDATKVLLSGGNRGELLASGDVYDVFNYMIAEWGLTGECPLDFARRVLIRRSESRRSSDANSLQCFAVCHSALDNAFEAREDLDEALAMSASLDMSFDCWSWRYVYREQMQSNLREMISTLARDEPLRPPFLQRQVH